MSAERESTRLDQLDRGAVRAVVAEVEAEPESGDEGWVTRLVRGWGRIGAGETPQAQARLRPLVESLESGGDVRLRAHALMALGVASVLGGEADAGTALLERALSLHTLPWPRAQCLRFSALALEQRGAWEGAAARYQGAADAYAAIPDDFGRGNALYGAAAALVELGREADAREKLQAAEAALRQVGSIPALGAALGLLATLTDDAGAAERLLAEADALTAGTPWMYRADWLLRGAAVALRLGRPARALELAEETLRVTVATSTEHVWAEHAAAAARIQLGDDAGAARVLEAPPIGEISGAARLERLSLRLGIAARAGQLAAADRLLDALERLVRAKHRRREVPRTLAEAAATLAGPGPEAAFRAARLALATGHPPATLRPLLAQLRRRGTRVPLGPLWLERLIGGGGMGQVWQALHPDGVPLAVKLLRPERSGEDEDLFEAEIAAVARLDHPNIVRVYAALRLDAAAAEVTERPAGTPALVMDLVEGGTLESHPGDWTWEEVRTVLLQLLDALGHAHARGVLHLDLKPGNVLMDARGRGPVARLTDFGLAGIARRAGAGAMFGTPAYLSPEQATGGRLGPATDLYGLGCLAWKLLVGQPIHGHVAPDMHIARHATAAVPRFEPRVAVPDGAEDWLRTMLARHPDDRFPCAADAAAALAGLGSATGVRAAPRPLMVAAPTLDLSRLTGPRSAVAEAPAAAPPVRTRVWGPAPLREAWREPVARSQTPFLRGLGEGLLDAREGRWVGRDAERDTLWQALTDVHRDGVPRCLWIVGADGMGRSALLRWMAETASAVGAAWVIEPRPPDWADAERAVHLARRDRPLLVLLDDADGEPAQRVAASLRRSRTLVVGASRRAPAHVATTGILTLGPLPAAAIGELLDGRLPLDRTLAARITGRSAGVPSFALALLRDLIRRDVLEPGPEGFRPIDGAELPLPRELLASWSARLDALAPPGSPARSAWELAATFGADVPLDAWSRAAARAGLPTAEHAFAAPEAEGWLEHTATHARFPLPAAREALLAGAETGGRAATWHAAAADALIVDGAAPAAAGRHLARSGRHADALRPLRVAAADAINGTRIDECRELLELWDGCADALGIAPDDVRRASPLVVRVHLALHTDADPYPVLARAEALAAGKDAGLESQITYSHAWVLARDGRHAEAEPLYLRAIALADAAGLGDMHAVANLGLATSVYALGRDATPLLDAVRGLPAAAVPFLAMRFDACAGRGLLRLGRSEDAAPFLRAALEQARSLGASDVEADASADLADAAERAGHPDELVHHLRAAVTALAPTGSDKALAAQVRLAGGLVWAAREDEARAVLAPLRARFGGRLTPSVVAEHALVEIALGDRPAEELEANRTKVSEAEPAVRRLLRAIGRRQGAEGGGRSGA